MKQFPDHRELENVKKIKAKSEVLHLGMDLQKFNAFAPFDIEKKSPIILWNHRWEYDKNPDVFFKLLFKLADEGIDFQLVVLGEKYNRYPKIFDEAKERLKNRILHFGFAKTFEEYARWTKTADLLPVTSNQDFFGGSVVEAMYCKVMPLLPNRLAYPEHLESEDFLYDDEAGLYTKMKGLLVENFFSGNAVFSDWVKEYDWRRCIGTYDRRLGFK